MYLCRDDLDRQLQAQTTAEILANVTNPIVMLSYITNRHGSRDYKTIVEKGNMKVRAHTLTHSHTLTHTHSTHPHIHTLGH